MNPFFEDSNEQNSSFSDKSGFAADSFTMESPMPSLEGNDGVKQNRPIALDPVVTPVGQVSSMELLSQSNLNQPSENISRSPNSGGLVINVKQPGSKKDMMIKLPKKAPIIPAIPQPVQRNKPLMISLKPKVVSQNQQLEGKISQLSNQRSSMQMQNQQKALAMLRKQSPPQMMVQTQQQLQQRRQQQQQQQQLLLQNPQQQGPYSDWMQYYQHTQKQPQQQPVVSIPQQKQQVSDVNLQQQHALHQHQLAERRRLQQQRQQQVMYQRQRGRGGHTFVSGRAAPGQPIQQQVLQFPVNPQYAASGRQAYYRPFQQMQVPQMQSYLYQQQQQQGQRGRQRSQPTQGGQRMQFISSQEQRKMQRRGRGRGRGRPRGRGRGRGRSKPKPRPAPVQRQRQRKKVERWSSGDDDDGEDLKDFIVGDDEEVEETDTKESEKMDEEEDVIEFEEMSDSDEDDELNYEVMEPLKKARQEEEEYIPRRSNRLTRKEASQTYSEFIEEEMEEQKRRKKSKKKDPFERPAILKIHQIVNYRDTNGRREYLIKWTGWSHLNNTWVTKESLKGVKGLKKLDNFMKKVEEFEDWKEDATEEEIEQRNLENELEEMLREKHKIPDRIITFREVKMYVTAAGQSVTMVSPTPKTPSNTSFLSNIPSVDANVSDDEWKPAGYDNFFEKKRLEALAQEKKEAEANKMDTSEDKVEVKMEMKIEAKVEKDVEMEDKDTNIFDQLKEFEGDGDVKMDDKKKVKTPTTPATPNRNLQTSPANQQKKLRKVKQYLTKWTYLPYDECTWETHESLPDIFRKKIVEFENRLVTHPYYYPKIDRDIEFQEMTEDPEWIPDGLKLRDYQLTGINWLVVSWTNRTNVILADEMGLGKTIQSIVFLRFLMEVRKIPGPFLIVVPLSTISNWMNEFERWHPDCYVIPYVGNSKSREIIRKFELFDKRSTEPKPMFNVLLTTYELILKDARYLKNVRFSYLIVDEAHRLKNNESKLYQVLIQFESAARLFMTGTPLQNTIKELWALLHFLQPNKFKTFESFYELYSVEKLHDGGVLKDLHNELQPHILRRVKSQVEKSLPQKLERILRVELTPIQEEFYKGILEKNFEKLTGGRQKNLMNLVIQLKKCCNHPYLFHGAKETIRVKIEEKTGKYNYFESIVKTSGKMILLDKLLVRLRETGHRVLIFSQMVRTLDILQEYCGMKGFFFQRLDGNTSATRRRQVLDHFNAKGSMDFLFLLSTRAGGLGLNLSTADTVIIFDSDWNPQNDIQAESRAHRIGQTKAVNIYRFITKNSVEEKILETAKRKMVLEHLVIQKMDTSGRVTITKDNSKKANFTREEIQSILQFGARDLFAGENSEKNDNAINEMSIDDILCRAEVVKDEKSDNSKLLGAFNVANFNILPSAQKRIQKKQEREGPDRKRKKKRSEMRLLNDDDVEIDPFWTNLFPEQANQMEKKSFAKFDLRIRKTRNKIYKDIPRKNRDFVRIAGVSPRDTRDFITSFKKFADLKRCEEVVRDAGLDGKFSDEQIRELSEKLVDSCEEALENTPIDPLKRRSVGPKITFNSVKGVAAGKIVRRMKEIEACHKFLQKAGKRNPYKEQPNQRMVKKWQVEWTKSDDLSILKGSLKHGVGNWEKIRLDAEYGLQEKICPEVSEAYVGRMTKKELQKRLDYLLAQIWADSLNEDDDEDFDEDKMDIDVRKRKGDKMDEEEDNEGFSKPRPKKKRQKKRPPPKKKKKRRAPAKKKKPRTRKVPEKELIQEPFVPPRPRQTRSKTKKRKEEGILTVEEMLSDMTGIFAELRSTDTMSNRRDRLPIIKKCLRAIGERVESVIESESGKNGNTKESLSYSLWMFVEQVCENSRDYTLKMLYNKMKRSDATKDVVVPESVGEKRKREVIPEVMEPTTKRLKVEE